MLKKTAAITAMVLGLCVSPGAAQAAQAQGYTPMVFDGQSFHPGEASGSILVKDGRLPFVATGEGIPGEELLPAGTGAVGFFCFLQSSGGKLRPHSRVVPIAGVAVTVIGKGITLAARTDSSGYLILALPPGVYDFKAFGFVKRVVVEQGKTALAFLRGGKRMVD